MKPSIWYLENCSTCKRIMNELGVDDHWILREIKTAPITPDELDEMKEYCGSYEGLFSRRAMKYRGMGLHEQELNEEDYRRLILEEYTFLKRPVIKSGSSHMLKDPEFFVGNSKKVVAAAKEVLS